MPGQAFDDADGKALVDVLQRRGELHQVEAGAGGLADAEIPGRRLAAEGEALEVEGAGGAFEIGPRPSSGTAR
ncbi:hypothetical protein [Martelella radicis]|uniref:Uncharacterized protein n=1 Tax=Martelella radicis TaxID=1397476 RepID=A0A7W6KFI8_9HYPH|nr:hypothetical protein [Martelella radicis]